VVRSTQPRGEVFDMLCLMNNINMYNKAMIKNDFTKEIKKNETIVMNNV